VNELKCYRCGKEIFFDSQWKSKNDKLIPLDPNTKKPHNCPKSKYNKLKSIIKEIRAPKNPKTYREFSSFAQQLNAVEQRDLERSRPLNPTIKKKFKPKHTISDTVQYLKDKTKLGGLIIEGMETTGGTDIDWLIEHHGGFIVLENKEFNHDFISIPLGQMIALERLHEKLDCDNKCHLLVVGYDDIDFSNPNSRFYYFDMREWKEREISSEKDDKYKRYKVFRKDMRAISLWEFRKLMEKYWKEFENS